MLNLAPMNKLLSVDKKISVSEPGITIHDLGKQLEKHDLVFQTTADFSGITVAGGLGTGAHHSSLKIGSGIHDYVTRLKLVNAEGNFVELVGEQAQNAAIHLGYLGAIVEVELKVDDMHKLRYGYISGDDDGVESIIEDEVEKTRIRSSFLVCRCRSLCSRLLRQSFYGCRRRFVSQPLGK